MKSAALCLLAITTPACNWVFGIEETLLRDAAISIDAPLPTARLTWLVAVTDPQGVPTTMPEERAISPAPIVEIGRIGEALTAAPIDDTGTIRIPYDYENSTWRLVYQLADDVPHEIHWSTMMGQVPHAIVPLFGRLDRSPIPGPNTTMTMTPSNGMPANHSSPRVFTTGVWTQSQPAFGFPAGPTFTYNLNQSIQLSGPAGAPDAAKGDQVVLVDHITQGTCRTSSGSATFKLQLADGASTTISADPWTNTGKVVVVTADPLEDPVRVALAASTGTGNVTTIVQLGPAASSTMPGFTQRGPERVPQLGLRGPLLLPMLDCTDLTGTMPPYNLPDALSVFPQVAHIQLIADRTVVGGPTLTYGLAAIKPIATGAAAFDIDVAMPVPPFMLGSVDVAVTDGAPLPGGSDPLVLTFDIEPNAVSDYYEVALHRVSGMALTLERVYTILAPTLTFERSVLTAGATYVLEIRAFRGAPDARAADFTRYLSTQSSAVVWSHTFVPL